MIGRCRGSRHLGWLALVMIGYSCAEYSFKLIADPLDRGGYKIDLGPLELVLMSPFKTDIPVHQQEGLPAQDVNQLWCDFALEAPTFVPGVRRGKAALFQWVQVPPGNYRSGRKQSEQSWR